MRPDPSRRSEILPLGAVLAVALAARVSTLLSVRGDISIRVPLLDALYYLQTATGLAHGAGWPAGPHFMAPIYPFLLSALFRLAPGSVETVQWAQLVVGIGTTLFVYLAARRISKDAALAAGLLYALCGPAMAYENQVLMECILAFTLAVFVWIAGETPPIRIIPSGVAGLAIGLATAGRPTYALLFPIALAVTAQTGPTRYSWRRKEVLLCAIGFLVVVVPPSVRNTMITGHPSFVTTSGGLNLYIGNHAGASGIYSQPAGLFLEKDPTGARSASQMAGRTLTAEEASRFYAKSALEFIERHPGTAARLWIRKIGYFLSSDEIPQIESFDSLRDDHPLIRFAGPIVFAVLFPLALLGIFRRVRVDRTAAASLAVVVSGALAHLIFFSTGRYRAAILPAIAVLAGGGAVAILDTLRRKSAGAAVRELWPVPAAVVILLIAPRYDRSEALAWTKHQTAIRYEQIGADRTAETLYMEAIAADSTLGESWHNMAACQVREGRTADAIRTYERALLHLGENPVTLYNLAVLYGDMGMDERALGYFNRAVKADPADLDVRVDRGIGLYRLNRHADAFADWRYVASRAPDNASLVRTLGRLLGMGADLPADLTRLTPSR